MGSRITTSISHTVLYVYVHKTSHYVPVALDHYTRMAYMREAVWQSSHLRTVFPLSLTSRWPTGDPFMQKTAFKLIQPPMHSNPIPTCP